MLFAFLKNIHLLIQVRSRIEQKWLFEKLKLKRSSESLHGLNYDEYTSYPHSSYNEIEVIY